MDFLYHMNSTMAIKISSIPCNYIMIWHTEADITIYLIQNHVTRVKYCYNDAFPCRILDCFHYRTTTLDHNSTFPSWKVSICLRMRQLAWDPGYSAPANRAIWLAESLLELFWLMSVTPPENWLAENLVWLFQLMSDTPEMWLALLMDLYVSLKARHLPCQPPWSIVPLIFGISCDLIILDL